VGHAKAYVLTDPVRAHGEAHGGGEGEVCGRLGGGGKGRLRVFFLAALRSKHRTESGFGLSLPPTYAWAGKGEAVRVPRAWGKSGRVNAVAHLERRSCGGWALGYALLEGRCGTGEVVAYLEGLSREVARAAAVQSPFEPGGSAVRLCSDHLAAGEGVSDAPAALQERGGAEGGGGRGYGEAQGTAGARGVAKSMHWHLRARALVSQHGVPKPGLWKGFSGASTAAKAAAGYLAALGPLPQMNRLAGSWAVEPRPVALAGRTRGQDGVAQAGQLLRVPGVLFGAPTPMPSCAT
jgi:hypothetical protein